ncbi:hypothetical protein ALC57_10995 [Trachymyrmex cornetzi]|uniref:Odorant receptor 13a n=1 Tax=Trachymyrmex cornetzi TaxID=471704 RepID=A0A195DV94_9HYME|nr:hypothetical protein ALC57_10995 [Trachymyrmex cornetzi]
MLYSMITIFLLIPLTPVFLDIIRPLNESRPRFFAVAVELRIDQEKYYIPVFCYNFGIIILGVIIMVGVDTTYVAYTTHACSLFSIISQQFEEILLKLNVTKQISKYELYLNKDFELLSEKERYRQYIICLKKYQLALEFVNILNSTYQVSTLFLLLLNGITISLVGIRIVYVLSQLKEIMRYGFIIIGMLIQLMIVCYSGQKLIDESQNIFYQANIMLVHVLREYNVNKILLSHLGLWPLQNKFVRRLLPILYLVIHISSLPFEILSLHDMLGNMQRAFENFYYIVCCILFIVKLSNEFLNDEIRYSYKAMENHWNIFTGEFEMRILKNYSSLSRKFTIIYAITMYIMVTIYIMVPIKSILLDVILPLNESRPRFSVLSIEYRIDKDKYFVPLFCYNITVVVTGVTILVGIETMYVTRTIHACSLFSIISQQFEKIISQTGISMKASEGGRYMNGMNALFKSASEQLIYDEYIICLKKYQLALKYAVEWYTFSPRLKSLIIITLHRSLVPCSLRAVTLYFMTVIFIMVPFKPILLDIILPLNESRPRFFILPIEWRVDKDKYFIPILCYSTITVVTGMIILVSVETIYITRTIHACGLFSIIRFVDVLNSMYRIVALISLLFAVVIISLVGIKVNIISYYLYYYYKLLYAVKWYTFSPRLKSLLITTLHRSFIPCGLTAGNLFSLSMATFAAILTLYIHRYSGQIIFESLYQMVVTMAFLIKFLNQIWNRNKFRRLYEIMENHWNIFTNDLEVRILKSYSHISQKFTLSYSILMYIMMSMFITIPSLGPMLLDVVLPLNKSRLRNIAIYTEYGIDQDKYFVPIFLYTSIMITVGITIMVAVDTMHIACTSHACSLFQLIGYVDILNDTHKIVGISFLLLIAAVFSLLGVRIVYVLDQLEELIRFTFIIMGALLQLMIVCYSGQKLMDESQNIFHRT